MHFDLNRMPQVALNCVIGLMFAANASFGDSCDQDSVREVVDGIIAADNVEDIERVLAYYATDAVLIVPDGPDVVGLAAIRNHYENLFANADFVIVPRIDEIVLDRDRAIVRGMNRVMTTSNGEDRLCVASKYLMTLKREESRWKIAHLMWSNQKVPC